MHILQRKLRKQTTSLHQKIKEKSITLAKQHQFEGTNKHFFFLNEVRSFAKMVSFGVAGATDIWQPIYSDH